MEFFEKNKTLVIQVVAGALLGLVLSWLDLPAWVIGAAVAAVISLWTSKLVESYDTHIAPRINAAKKND